MRNTFLKILAKFNLVELVYTKDFDGEIRLRIKRTSPDFGDYVFGLTDGSVIILNDDGTCGGDRSYIKKWKPYKGQFKQNPKEVLEYYEQQMKRHITSG